MKLCTAYPALFGGLMAGLIAFLLLIRLRASNNAFREVVRYEASDVFSRRWPHSDDLLRSGWQLGVRPVDVNWAVRQS